MSAKSKRLIYNLVTISIVVIAYVVFAILLNHDEGVKRSERIVSSSMKGQLVPICCWIVMAVSLNLVVGFSGELSLGHAGFMSIGAFTGIVVSGWLLKGFDMTDTTLRLIISICAGGVMAGIMGFLIGIPVLRLRGDYLAIVTLAFGEIIRNVLNCVYVSVEDKHLNWGFLNSDIGGTLLLNGPNGAKKVEAIATFTGGFILVMIALVVVIFLVNSRTGRAIKATRDNRIAAESMGIQVTRYKMIAFVTASVLAGMAGALYGLNAATTTPAKFSFNESINVLVFVVLGGIGNILGSVISATALTILPEKLRFLQDYRMLVYAVVLILAMILSNNALVKRWISAFTSLFRRKRNMNLFAEESRNAFGGTETGQSAARHETVVIEEDDFVSETFGKKARPVPEIEREEWAAEAEETPVIGRLFTADGAPLDDETQRRIELGLMLYEAYAKDGEGKKKKGKKKEGGGKA